VRVLLDECIDRRLAKDIVGHDVMTVAEMGWKSKRNGDLLALAERAFDVFITVDSNLSFQQNLPRFGIRVIVLRAPSNRLADLRSLVPKLIESLPKAKYGEVLRLSI